MSTDTFFQNILENMADGVMALDFEGRISMFNAAAGEILGYSPEDVCGEPFAAIFLAAAEENDDFNQVVLDAIYRKGIGLATTVEYTRAPDTKLTLSVRSSYLKSDESQEDSGIVLVFSDITEIKALQVRQEDDARKLGQAYLKLEENNQQLHGALKRVKAIRVTATLLTFVLFAGFGFYYFQGGSLIKKMPLLNNSSPTTIPISTQQITVEQRPLSSSISLSGLIAPLEEIIVTAPFDALIDQRHFAFGQMVEKGELLLSLNTTELEVKLRNARGEYIRANRTHHELLHWESGAEMTRARRSLMRAKETLEVSMRKFTETQLLFEKGVIPAQELESASRQVANSQEDVRAAEEEIKSMREKAGEENLLIAAMDLENARVNLEALEAQMSQRNITSPVAGVVIRPSQTDDKTLSLEKGARISSGMHLLAVGNMNGVIVTAKIDEIDVSRMTTGQPVRASGDAFPGVVLEGVISHISAQATTGSGQSGSSFDTQVVFPDLDQKTLKSIRVGMSADLDVVVYDKQDALIVPLPYVRVMRGVPTVRRLEADGKIQETPVKTGITTLNQVEILSGLNPGDRLTGWQ